MKWALRLDPRGSPAIPHRQSQQRTRVRGTSTPRPDPQPIYHRIDLATRRPSPNSNHDAESSTTHRGIQCPQPSNHSNLNTRTENTGERKSDAEPHAISTSPYRSPSADRTSESCLRNQERGPIPILFFRRVQERDRERGQSQGLASEREEGEEEENGGGRY